MKGITLIIILLTSTALMLADTTINPGSVSGTWTGAGSPYQVMGNIIVNATETLTIEPGVEVIFNGTYKLDVMGRIICNGEQLSPVVFTAQDTLNGWQSIRFSNTAANQPSSFDYTEFYYAKAVNGPTGMDPLNFGGAVWADNAGTLTFNNCMFRRCKSSQDGSAVYAINNTNIIMNGCTVKNCESGFFGGVFVKNGTAEIQDCVFLNNSAVTFAAAIYFYECTSANVTSCHIINNSAGAVTGIYGYSSPVVVMNSLIQGNDTVTGLGGGLGIIFGTLEVTNCTFEGNTSPMGGGAIWINSLDSPAELTNNIFWNNLPSAISSTASSYNLSYCSMQTQEGDATNIWGDPLFEFPAGGLFTLQQDSPCIDAGTPDVTGLNLPDYDLSGHDRITDGNNDSVIRIDIGCYEYQPVLSGTLTGTVTDADNQPLAGVSLEVDGNVTTTDAAGTYNFILPPGSYEITCSIAGYYSVTVTVTIIAGGVTTQDFVLEPVANEDGNLVSAPVSLSSYPNPFLQTVTVRLELDKAGEINLDVYNLKGQKVRSLCSTSLPAGKHAFTWNGMDANNRPAGSGIYLLKLKQADRQITSRLLKLK